jgi:hypothetical protein
MGHRMATNNRQDSLKLGKGAAFVKSQLIRLRQEAETWEVDFRLLPKPIMQTETHYVGLVVTVPRGLLLADTEVKDRPSVNDLATLLTNAMRCPLIGNVHRPRRIFVRGLQQWRQLFPHLEEVGIKAYVQHELPKFQEAHREYIRQMEKARRVKMMKPTTE